MSRRKHVSPSVSLQRRCLFPAETNEVLFVRFRSDDDPDAFRVVFERTVPEVTRLARRLDVPPSEIEDVVQDTYVAALVGARRFDPSQDLLRWLRGILFNKVLLARRRHMQRQLRPDRLRPRFTEEPAMCLEADEIRRALHDSIGRLPDPYREVLHLYYLQRVSAESIAEELGRSASTVRTQIARGLSRLRERLPTSLRPGGPIAVTARPRSA